MDNRGELSKEDVYLSYLAKHRHQIYNFIFSLLPNTADAEDVFQQASIVMWKCFRDFDQNREFYPWACGVALNAVKNFRRSAKRRRFLLNDELLNVMAEEKISASQRSRYRLDLLEECITRLKPVDRDLIRQVYVEESSARSVAEQLGRSVQTIYNRLNLIRKSLLDCVNRKSTAS